MFHMQSSLKIVLQYFSLATEVIFTNLILILPKIICLTHPDHFLNFAPKTHFFKNMLGYALGWFGLATAKLILLLRHRGHQQLLLSYVFRASRQAKVSEAKWPSLKNRLKIKKMKALYFLSWRKECAFRFLTYFLNFLKQPTEWPNQTCHKNLTYIKARHVFRIRLRQIFVFHILYYATLNFRSRELLN